ncbi:hypothetical protein COCNU_16G007860 [Cocos nucifera]|uniref:Uncharacterized protein n=1 Tax=Cocos nucifera TaxID=13894 RepID=A0A8K0NET8_COCNU|nr:hypothetical protein COCNU_16G007860 [Cocos nucifera]
MYSEFDNVSFSGTFQSHRNSSKLIPIQFISRRPILGTPDELEDTHKLAVAMEQKQEDDAIPPPPPPPSSSSSENQINTKEKPGEAVAPKGDNNDDDGYQTPTCPRNRIPPAIKCPPAPKKPKMPKRWQCMRIKSGTCRVRRRIEIGSHPCPDFDDLSPRRKKKKARGDATAYQ